MNIYPVVYFIIFTLFYFSLGILVCNQVFRKKIDKRFFFFLAPAFSLSIFSLVSLVSFMLNMRIITLLFILISSVYIIINYKFLTKFFLDLDRYSKYALAVFLSLIIVQSIFFSISSANIPAGGNTWTIFNISSISPPDQTFAWHQARFFQNNLKYGQDKFYGDVDLFDRPFLGGFLTDFSLLGHKIPKEAIPDSNFIYDRLFSIYRVMWWGFNDLVIVGVAFFFYFLKKKKSGYLAIGLLATSMPVIFLSSGLWVKLLPLYFYIIVLYFHFSRSNPILKGIFAGVTFWLHSSLLVFIIPLILDDLFTFIYPYIKKRIFDRAKLIYALKFIFVASFIVCSWFSLTFYFKAPQSLSFAYRYNAGWTEVSHQSADTLKERFYNSTTKVNLVALPFINTAKSIIPGHTLNLLESFQYKDKNYFSIRTIAETFSQDEFTNIFSVLGITLSVVTFIGFVKLFFDKKERRKIILLYLFPTILMALLYRIDSVIQLQIATPYILVAVYAFCYFFEKVKAKVLLIALLSIHIVNTLLSSLFSAKFSQQINHQLFYRSDGSIEYNWIWFVVVLVLIGLSSYKFSLDER